MSSSENISILHEFGLSGPEAHVYLALLELGPQPASVIAKKAALKRGHTYNILTSLKSKGIVQEFIKSKVTYFSSRPAATLMTELEHRKEKLSFLTENLARIIPNLEKLGTQELLQPKVRFFQGVEGVKEIYENTIRTPNKTVYALGDFDYFFPEDQSKELFEWVWNFASRRAKRGVWFYGIINKSEKSDIAFRRRREQKRKLKMLTGIYLPVEFIIYDNSVAVMSTYRDMVGLIIDDAPIAETLRNFHQAMWTFLPDYKL